MPSIVNKWCIKGHGLYTENKCPKCNKDYNNNVRDKESTDFYNSRTWRKVSQSFLMSNPVCVMCGKPAQHSDHIVAIKNGGDRYSFSNLQALCISCHNIKELEAGNRW